MVDSMTPIRNKSLEELKKMIEIVLDDPIEMIVDPYSSSDLGTWFHRTNHIDDRKASL